MSKFKDYLKKQADQIRSELTTFIKQQPLGSSTLPWNISSQLAQFAVSGKLVRGSLVLLGYEAFVDKVNSTENALKAAMAVELAHSALLIQDDIMDQDQKRRGQLTIHEQNRQTGSKLSAADEQLYGYAAAICSADLLFFWACQLLNQAQMSQETKQQLLAEFSQNMINTVWGQIDDVNLSMLEIEAEKQDIVNVLVNKTARYTLVNPLLCGAILAGASQDRLSQLETFAQELGVVFQIKDDELSLLGEESKIGKSVGNDIAENKQTLHRYLLFERADSKDRKRLSRIFGSKQPAAADLAFVREKLDQYQVLSAVQAEVGQRLEIAAEALTNLQLSPGHRRMFESLVEFITNRDH